MFISTLLEMIGLGFIFSIVGVLSPQNIGDNIFISQLSHFFEFDQTKIISYLLFAFLLFYIFKIIFLLFYLWSESKFLHLYKEYLWNKWEPFYL